MVVASPRALHADTVRDESKRFALDLGDGRRLFWCPINRVGSIHEQSSGRWISEGPLGFMEFLCALSAVGLEVVADHSEAERWVETCLVNEAAATVRRMCPDTHVDGENDPFDAPQAPDRATLQDPRYTILDATGTRLVTWCPRNRAGSIYHAEARIWSTIWPVTFGDFMQWLETRGVCMDTSDDLDRWIEACTQFVRTGRC